MQFKKHTNYALLALIVGGTSSAADPLLTVQQRQTRRTAAKSIRDNATNQQFGKAVAGQPINTDVDINADLRGVFGKSLAHAGSGFVETAELNKLLNALRGGSIAQLAAVGMGTNPVERRLVDPSGARAFNLDGADGWIFSMPAPAGLSSAETGGEMVELYWHALIRDVFFNDYDTDSGATDAITDLNAMSDFKGPKIGGVVTDQTLFRGNAPGETTGPFISQFLYKPIPYGPASNYDGSGSLPIAYQEQVVPTTTTANDFMKTFSEWLDIQKGKNPAGSITYSTARTFIRNARDLGDYVHQDYPQQAYFNAALILLGMGASALDPNYPYVNTPTEEAFPTFNVPDLLYLIGVAAENALRTAWYQKWLVHRRVRPEFYGFLIHEKKTGSDGITIHDDLANSDALVQIFAANSTYFLPQAYPEGSPTHPSYPAGHAAVAGACATILKAFFNEDFVVPSPIEPNAGNTALAAYGGADLTVGGELNKLASNISLGRDMAGVHYRSDGWQGMLLGEKVALEILRNEAKTRHIPFYGYTLTTFDGTKVIIGANVSKDGAPLEDDEQ